MGSFGLCTARVSGIRGAGVSTFLSDDELGVPVIGLGGPQVVLVWRKVCRKVCPGAESEVWTAMPALRIASVSVVVRSAKLAVNEVQDTAVPSRQFSSGTRYMRVSTSVQGAPAPSG